MANTITLKTNSVSGTAPLASDLVEGELALNTADEKLYTKNSAGSVVQINAGGGGGSSTLAGLSDVTVSTATPSGAGNAGTPGDFWINKSVGESYVCSFTSSAKTIWVNQADSSKSVGGVTHSYNGKYATTGNSLTYTWNNAPIGEAASNRKVVVMISNGNNNANNNFSYCTIGGVTATVRVNTRSTDPDNRMISIICDAEIASGTTAEIKVYYTGTAPDNQWISNYSVYGATSVYDTASDTVDSAGYFEVDIDTNPGGVLLAFAAIKQLASGDVFVWSSNMTEDDQYDQGYPGYGVASATGLSTGTETVGVQMNDTTPDRSILQAVYYT